MRSQVNKLQQLGCRAQSLRVHMSSYMPYCYTVSMDMHPFLTRLHPLLRVSSKTQPGLSHLDSICIPQLNRPQVCLLTEPAGLQVRAVGSQQHPEPAGRQQAGGQAGRHTVGQTGRPA